MFEPKRPHQTEGERRDAYRVVDRRDSRVCQGRGILPKRCFGGVQHDHRQNRDEYNTVPSNLVLLCAWHHQWKTVNPAAAGELGFAVSRYDVPSRTAMRRVVDAAGTVKDVFLDDDGFVWEQEVLF